VVLDKVLLLAVIRLSPVVLEVRQALAVRARYMAVLVERLLVLVVKLYSQVETRLSVTLLVVKLLLNPVMVQVI